jgi:hypothetical protein
MNKIKPDITIDMDEKIYLAVAKDTTGKLAFIYTLACLKKSEDDAFPSMLATREIHAFKDKTRAELYYDTLHKIVELNTEDSDKEGLFAFNEKLIDKFINDNSR